MDETLEQFTYRIIQEAFPSLSIGVTFNEILDNSDFRMLCHIISLVNKEKQKEIDALSDEISRLKDVIASYENQSPVAWINRDGTYVELSTKSTVYGSHTIPLIMQNEIIYKD